MEENNKTNVIFGSDSTGHYWLNLVYFLTAKGFDFGLVELDGIAQLIKDGRYFVPNLLEGIYARTKGRRQRVKLRNKLA